MKSERGTNTDVIVDYGGKPVEPNRFYLDARFGLSYVTQIGPDSINLEQGPNGCQHVDEKESGGTYEQRHSEVQSIASRLMHLSNYEFLMQAANYDSTLDRHEWLKEKVKALAKSPIKPDIRKSQIKLKKPVKRF